MAGPNAAVIRLASLHRQATRQKGKARANDLQGAALCRPMGLDAREAAEVLVKGSRGASRKGAAQL